MELAHLGLWRVGKIVVVVFSKKSGGWLGSIAPRLTISIRYARIRAGQGSGQGRLVYSCATSIVIVSDCPFGPDSVAQLVCASARTRESPMIIMIMIILH